MISRERIRESFRQALEEGVSSGPLPSSLSPRSIAHRARALYAANAEAKEKIPSPETFRKFATGAKALPEIVRLLNGANVLAARRVRIPRREILAALRKAVQHLAPKLIRGSARPLDVARLARRIFSEDHAGQAAPSLETFRRLVHGKSAHAEIAALIGELSGKIDREQILLSFEKALAELSGKSRAPLRPRTVSMRAHALYAADLKPGRAALSPETFRKFASGPRALPEVLEKLAANGIRPMARASIDRERLRAVFQEAIQRLETRIFKGQARPLQIARRAHEIYSREETSPPSQQTFQRLVYGKVADPEITQLIQNALKGKGQP